MSVLLDPRVARVARALNAVGLSRLNHFARALIERLSGNKLTVEVDGLAIQGTLDSWQVLTQIRSGNLEPLEVELFKQALRPGMTVLDVGANIGYYTLLAAQRVGKNGAVYSFEPDARTCKSLRANLKRNAIGNVSVIEKGASDRRAERVFYLSRTASHSGMRRSMQEGSVVGTTTVETVPIDDVLEGAPVNVIKMDIEGEESAALRGMERTFAASPDVLLFVEFSPAALATGGVSGEEFVAQLRSSFEEILVIDERGRRLTPLTPEAMTRRQNLYCRRRASAS